MSQFATQSQASIDGTSGPVLSQFMRPFAAFPRLVAKGLPPALRVATIQVAGDAK